MSAVSGYHICNTVYHGLLGHTALKRRRQTTPAFKRCVTQGNSEGASESNRPASANRPERPKNWQKPSRQAEQTVLSNSQPAKKFARKAPQQTVGLEGLRSPPQITTFIKQQQQVALRLTTGPDPEAGLISFCASMDGLLSIPGLRSDYIHFSAITTAAAHIWKGAQQSSRFRGHADVSVEGLYRRCLQSLQPLLADMGAQAISNVLWSSATLSFNPDDAVPGMVDTLTSRFLHLINVAEARQTPNAYDVANVLWALAQLKHAPSHAVVAAMFDRLVALCHIPGLQPNSQDISNSLVACAELRLVVRPTFVEALVKQFLGMHVSNASYQHYCNAAWGLAVKQCLDLNTFAALLDKVITKHNLFVDKSGPQSTSAQLAPAEVSQLYQAFAWLRPPSGSRQMQGWSNLQSRLLTVAPEPGASKVSLPGQTVMWAALAMQEVPYKAQVQRGVYCVHALLSPRDSGIAEVMLMVEGPGDHLVNLPSRLAGSAAFRNQLLARYGTVVTIPYKPDTSTAKSMAEDIKAAVEARTGLPLDFFRS